MTFDRATAQTILAEVRANHAKLNACLYHEFELIYGYKPTDFKRRYACVHCGGTIDGSAYYWHEQGRRPSPDTPVS